ncbi:glycosyltransferase WbsX-domain-containing protein [Leptodontidium sp. MPI-SDFR-AT-0119]|nr:glycosyltransferase WbsX-domain-containing protein [Leptodontidium sp. MPI-SDFR-AT-0119]
MMVLQFNRHFQKVAILSTLFLCTTLLYFHQSPIPYIRHQIPQLSSSSSSGHVAQTSEGYSIKPLVYIFPQYYVFEDNNILHGENFTEWVNVKKVTHNAFGLETIRPHESIGFYNGLEFRTRERQGRFLRDHGFYGAVFHHYWFAGRPVMEHVIQKMLEDGEPNIPFMLSWANEPWSARWDGSGGNGKVLIAQEYGLQVAWRKHFDWLLPFFRHPKYIRSNGRIQFVVYNPTHIGHIGPQMFAAWRQWAVEEGLGGMDIIETRWGEGSDKGPDSWEGYPPDAVNEFAPHAGGRDQATFSSLKKMTRVYHRGTLACWDTTPRHPTDHLAVSLPTCHPRTWQHHLVEMFRKIKSEPNPIGSENFFFVNALNEWGEGNSIEPSAQFGDGYGVAMKNALELSEKEHVWADISNGLSLVRDQEIAAVMEKKADACVLIRASPDNSEDKVFKLSAMLRSLQAQHNQNWRAVVFQSDRATFPELPVLVTRALDARVKHVEVSKDVVIPMPEGEDASFLATDWVIRELSTLSPGCASARYLLVTDGSNTYESSAFDSLSGSQDLIGLNVESRQHIWDHPKLQNKAWESRCSLLQEPGLNLCSASTPTLATFDLSATFFNLGKFQAENHSFDRVFHDFPRPQGGGFAEYLINERKWSFAPPQGNECHVRHNPAYSSCLKTGNFWFDSPVFKEMGCYSTTNLMRLFEKTSPLLEVLDLEFFRQNGYCVRYKEEAYARMLASSGSV